VNSETKIAEYPARLQVDYPAKLDKLTTFEEHPSAWERMRMAMGWKDA